MPVLGVYFVQKGHTGYQLVDSFTALDRKNAALATNTVETRQLDTR